jgi:acyl-coenzyme A synthetase/AMP-(fatty) acid ligase
VIHGLLDRASDRAPDEVFLVDRGRTWTRAASQREVRRLASALRALGHARVMAHLEDSADLIHLVLAASAGGIELSVANRWSPTAELAAAAEAAEAGAVVVREPLGALALPQVRFESLAGAGDDGPAHGGVRSEGSLVVLTSGTTGRPRGARYTWSRLVSQVRVRDDQAGSRWILLYQLNHFAGLQVLAHVLANGCSLVVPATRDAGELREEMRLHRVTHASGTPTFWRMFCGLGAATPTGAALPDVSQITLGGEASTAELLAGLRRTFPVAVISQVYATTELGSCFSVSDDRPGFPASLLDDVGRAVGLKIVDGQLFVRSRHGMEGYTGSAGASPTRDADGWVGTGDLVERVGDRVEFRGRITETINVGGVKVHPLEVESVIASVPGVLVTRVFGKANPLAGALVAAEVVVAASYDARDVERAIRAACLARLNRYAQPRLIQVVDQIETRNQKITRRTADGGVTT